MNNTNHFQIQGSFENGTNHQVRRQDNVDLHFRNVPEDDATEIIKKPVFGTLKGIAYADQLNEIKVYRKTVLAEAMEVVQNHGFSKNRSEKWISESFTKVLGFQNDIVPETERAGQRILELTMDKHDYQRFRMEDVISQFRSKRSGKSVYNFEGIKGGACQSKASTVPTSVKRNIGINKNHIDKFNENINSIKVLNPDDPFVKDKFLRYLSVNKVKFGLIAITIIFEIKNIIVILMDENGQAMEKLTVHISQVVTSHIGAYIGAAIGSLLPGIGNFILGILGGIVFGLIGKSIGEIIISLFPKVQPSAGPVFSDYLSFIYGANSYFGDPLNEHNLAMVFGFSKSNNGVNVYDLAFKPPLDDDENKFIRLAYEPPSNKDEDKFIRLAFQPPSNEDEDKFIRLAFEPPE